MLSKKSAIKIQSRLTSAEKSTKQIFSRIQKNKGSLKASSVSSMTKEIRKLGVVASKSLDEIVSNLNGVDDVIKASKIKALDDLIDRAATVIVRAKVLERIVAEEDEFNELDSEDEEDEFNELDSEDEEEEDLDAEDEEDDLESEDEEEDLDAEDDEEELDSDDDEPVKSRRKASKNRRMKASKNRRMKANRRAGLRSSSSGRMTSSQLEGMWDFGSGI